MIKHGRDGWVLVEFEYTAESRSFRYERTVEGRTQVASSNIPHVAPVRRGFSTRG